MSYGAGMSPRFGSWSGAGQTQSAGTAIVVGVPPYRGAPGNSSPLIYGVSSDIPNWYGQPYTKVSYLGITSGSTAHTWYVMRPKNWTTIAEAVTANDTTVVVAADPGAYAANYKYPLPPGEAVGSAADNAIAGSDYVCYQLDDGTWHFSLVSSVSSLTLTLATGSPNVTGGGAAVGNVLFFFAAPGNTDPATGLIDPAFIPLVSVYTAFTAGDGVATALHPGDPLLVVNANASNASTLAAISGYYSKN